jgi:hypothetical protein
VTPERFWLAAVLFHAIVLAAAWRIARAWRRDGKSRLPSGRWLLALATKLALLAVVAYVTAVLAAVAVNLEGLRHLKLGSISGRLMSQALFGEAIFLTLTLASWHWEARERRRAAALVAWGILLLSVYVDAYHVEPRMLRVRLHSVDGKGARPGGTRLRVLHITDIQTPRIGAHEERALRTGLSYHPDLIVLTGDYVQNASRHPTEDQATKDLRSLMARIGFIAPLGTFATEGDVGPSCGRVFEGTEVRCLVDETALVTLPGGETLAITGLSRNHGRVRDGAWLTALMGRGPRSTHRMLISHSPDFVDALPEPVDLVLAGHTHGGQVVIPFFGPPRTASRLPRLYAGDLHDFRGTPLHVSRGVGMERDFTPPIRFFCPPEICILDVGLGRGAD